MARRFRDRKRRPGRRPGSRAVRKRILVLCEGAVTEPEYIEQFRRWRRNPRVEVQISREHGAPRTLVDNAKELKEAAERRARRERDDNLGYDEVWCVFDIDEHPNVPEAQQKARDNGISLAISNPCFELWLLLHFTDSPGPQTCMAVARLLKKPCPQYNKHVRFEDFEPGYQDAFRRAKDLQRLADKDGESNRNPTTGVFRLTASISGSDV